MTNNVCHLWFLTNSMFTIYVKKLWNTWLTSDSRFSFRYPITSCICALIKSQYPADMSKACELIMKEFQSRIICFDVFPEQTKLTTHRRNEDAWTKCRRVIGVNEMAIHRWNVGSSTKRRRINEMTAQRKSKRNVAATNLII